MTSALRAFRKQQAAERLSIGPGYSDSPYVLVDEIGVPWRTDQLRRVAYTLMKQTGIRRDRLYDARHACLTFLATSGVPDVVVSAWAATRTCRSRADLRPPERRASAGGV